MEIRVDALSDEKRKERPKDESKLGFGKIFTDHMFIMDYKDGAWADARIVPYQNLILDPAAMVLHYGQEVFEGLKAYSGPNNEVFLFRPMENLKRMNRSARRLCMPEIDENFIFDAMKRLILLDRDWIPKTVGASLYIRPNMIATEPALGVKPASEYIFYIILGPVGAYYPEGFNPVKIFVTDKYVRAVPGGVGETKTCGNYAASLLAAKEAAEQGFTQVLWLDGIERRYVEEVGTMNIFFKFSDEVVTPPLTGSILPGITRDSVIHMVKEKGLKMVERPISIEEVFKRIEDGSLEEVFGTGTAAIISPVGEIFYKDKAYVVGKGETGSLSKELYEELLDIQYGRKPDPYGWVIRLDE